MKAYVYTDASLERYAGRFVWLSINTEDPKNAAFAKRYPIPALPTVMVIDARREEVALRYVGGANVTQLKGLLDESEKNVRGRRASETDEILMRADRAASAGIDAEAAKLFEQALARAPKGWKSFGRAAEGLVFSLSLSGEDERCAVRGAELYPRVRGTVSAANVAATGLSCAVALPAEHTKRRDLLTTLEKATREVFDNPKIVLSDDDRSGLYLALIDARDASGDEEGTISLKKEWSEFLDAAAARARTATQRSVYDSHRLTAYMELGTPEKAIPMLEQSERDFPDDYNPPARLALAWKELKDYAKALAASDRAMTKVYGPRKLTVMNTRAEIFAAMGDPKAARETLAAAIDYAKALPEGQRSERRIASLEKKLAGMTAPE